LTIYLPFGILESRRISVNSIYHLFPLGSLGAPRHNDPSEVSSDRVLELSQWIPYLKNLECDTLLLGPVFQSETHGYDIIDPYAVDRRLGSNEAFQEACRTFRDAGISIMLDAVFNHVGRSFFAFRDLQEKGEQSRYRHWFHGLDFSRRNGLGDPFTYDTWDGHESLVKLNLENPDVREYLLGAVQMWKERFGISGLRLDAADVITPTFWPYLRRVLGPDSLLVGEMVHGDYRSVSSPDMLDGTTNYECYKGLYSSFNDGNLHEIAWSLNRQSGPDGIYRDVTLFNFADNHDVPRIASTLEDPRYLYPLHILLFTMPGIPSVYYGSEVGISGTKGDDDWDLRPALNPQILDSSALPHPDLAGVIGSLGRVRAASWALQRGQYRQISVSGTHLEFIRQEIDETVVVAINGSDSAMKISAELQDYCGDRTGRDLLNGDEMVDPGDDAVTVPPFWGRVITLAG
jgi:cyclomaltodextrinase / maltogenic alpha-amylase / neopullulanase